MCILPIYLQFLILQTPILFRLEIDKQIYDENFSNIT